MEKRPKKTLPQSLSLIAFCIELALVGVLFVPIVVVMEDLSRRRADGRHRTRRCAHS